MSFLLVIIPCVSPSTMNASRLIALHAWVTCHSRILGLATFMSYTRRHFWSASVSMWPVTGYRADEETLLRLPRFPEWLTFRNFWNSAINSLLGNFKGTCSTKTWPEILASGISSITIIFGGSCSANRYAPRSLVFHHLLKSVVNTSSKSW